jgi:ADP-ribose pyrophosphatase YjhB (NUDIX family)
MITCEFENGNKASLRHVVINIIAISDDKLLLVKRAAHLTNPGKWSLVGGFLDRDETLETCVLRELHEETGYEGTISMLFSIVDNPNRLQEDRQNVSFIYIVKIGDKTGTSDDESSAVDWFTINNLPKKEDWAFDHFEIAELYLKQIAPPQELPLIKSS